jgi:hypothetical protein
MNSVGDILKIILEKFSLKHSSEISWNFFAFLKLKDRYMKATFKIIGYLSNVRYKAVLRILVIVLRKFKLDFIG